MSTKNRSFALAVAAFQAGKYDDAKQYLSGCDPRQSAHLAALVERRLGHYPHALVLIKRALNYAPDNHEIYNNQALIFLDLGRADDAVASCEAALARQPGFSPARRTLGKALLALRRWENARSVFAALIAEGARDNPTQFGLASAELELGLTERALAGFERLIATGTEDSAVFFMCGRAAFEAGVHDRALSNMTRAHALAPSAMTLRELARMHWMLGDHTAFETLVNTQFQDASMQTVALELLKFSGADATVLADALRSMTPQANHYAVVAQAFVDGADAEAALTHADQALAIESDHAAAQAARISAHLMLGQTDEALAQTRRMQQLEPNAQHWIAYEATGLRLVGDPAYTQLVDVQHHVQTYSLPVPEGYRNIDDFNTALRDALEQLHTHSRRPIDQSLRHGTQTARDLTGVPNAVVKAYLNALDEPIRRYLAHVGHHDGHPLTGRNTGQYDFNGCWSVKLVAGGHHVNHIHPEGWISSAYYVSVPASSDEDRSGWIKFSEPPFMTNPMLEPERWIQPKAGLLVLFPSYLWHGTAPIQADGLRLTAPFDVVPR
ncbi:MAG: putative 2OG-Fe(II) oxygenase [Pseudomonadota bacterium]